jgi:ribosomal protein L36
MFAIINANAQRHRKANKEADGRLSIAEARKRLEQSRILRRKRKLMLMNENTEKVINDYVSPQ